jgi:hypothetical protein
MAIPGLDTLLGSVAPGPGNFRGQTTAGVSSSYAISLAKEQVPQYIRLCLDESVMLKEATFRNVRGEELEIPNIDIASRQMVGGLGEMENIEDADLAYPTFDSVSLKPQPFEMNVVLGTRQLLYFNIERAGVVQTVLQQLGTAYMNDLEEIVIHSSKTGSNFSGAHTGMGTTIDGWMTKAIANCHIYDHAAGYIRPYLFEELLSKIPAKWRQNADRSGICFWVPIDISEAWGYWQLSEKIADLSGFVVVDGTVTRYKGVPIKSVTKMHTSDAGILTQSGTASGLAQILLAAPRNLVVGYEPRMEINIGYDQKSHKVQYNHFFGQFDCGFDVYDSVAVAVNVTPDVDPAVGL